MSSPALDVAWCSHAAAEYAVTRWHYSATMPVGKLAKIGVWEDGVFIGAVLFGLGASPHLASSLNVGPTECCELVRVALREHRAPVTQIVADAIRLLKGRNPGLRLVVSFADPNHGHRGGIYQAGNWIYLGRTANGRGYRDANGKLLHSRVVTGSGWVKQFGRMTRVPTPDQVVPVDLVGKHRYVMPLDRSMRRQFATRALPYPTAP